MKKFAKRGAVCVAVVVFLISWAGARRSAHSAPTESQGVTAEALYAKNCAKCHGKDGRAKSLRGKMSGARNFTDPQWQARVSDDTLAASIADGRGSMPSFKKKLSDEQIKSLVAYVRQFKKQ